MKQIIFIFIFTLFYFTGFSQNSESPSSDQSKIHSLKVDSKLKVYPNPCRLDKVTIESNQEDISEISITNIAGKQVFKKKYQFTQIKSEIELSEVPNGIYLVKIKTEDNKVVAKKLIVSKE